MNSKLQVYSSMYIHYTCLHMYMYLLIIKCVCRYKIRNYPEQGCPSRVTEFYLLLPITKKLRERSKLSEKKRCQLGCMLCLARRKNLGISQFYIHKFFTCFLRIVYIFRFLHIAPCKHHHAEISNTSNDLEHLILQQ